MSKDFTILSAIHDYGVHFVEDFTIHLRDIIQPEDTILIDENVCRLYHKRLEPILSKVSHILLEPSEKKKSYQEVGPIVEQLIEGGFRTTGTQIGSNKIFHILHNLSIHN